MVWTPETDVNYVQSKQISFEQAAIRVLHRTWFPGISIKKIENAIDGQLNWDNYSKFIDFEGCGTPALGFIKDDRCWNFNVHNLLKFPLEQTIFWKLYEEQDCTHLVFPAVSMYGIFRFGRSDRDGIVKYTRKGDPFTIELMTNWAKANVPDGIGILEE